MSSSIVVEWLTNKWYFILFFIVCFSVLKQLWFIIGSWIPCGLLEIDENGIIIEGKENIYIKINDITKKIKRLKKNMVYAIRVESEIGLIKLNDWIFNENELIFIIRRYSVSPIIKAGQYISFMGLDSDSFICEGVVLNDQSSTIGAVMEICAENFTELY